MADGEALDRYLRSLPAERLQDVISCLEAYEEQFAPEHVVTGSVVLLNLLTELPDRQLGACRELAPSKQESTTYEPSLVCKLLILGCRLLIPDRLLGMFDLGPRRIVGRVVYRFVRSLEDPDVIAAAVRSILPQLTMLSAKEKLITLVGYREGQGHSLVSESAARRLEENWRGEVRAATENSLAAEDDILRTLCVVKRDSDPAEPQFDVPNSPSVTLALLRSARSEVRSQGQGSRAVRRSPRLQWDLLVDLCGSEDTL